MNDYEQMVPGSRLSSAFRSLSPSILGKDQVSTQPPGLEDLMPDDPQISGLGSLRDMIMKMMGKTQNTQAPGLMSLLGGI